MYELPSCMSAVQSVAQLIKYNNWNVTLSHWNTVMQMEFGCFLFFYCKTPYAQNNHVFIKIQTQSRLEMSIMLIKMISLTGKGEMES